MSQNPSQTSFPRIEHSGEVITWAEIAKHPPPFYRDRRRRGRKGQGLRYEKKVHEHFAELYNEEYVASPWFRYTTRATAKVKWAQPDALLFDFNRGIITLIEVKYQHTIDAYWQLMRYLAITQYLFGSDEWQYSLCEVVKWYDAAVSFPVSVQLLDSLERSKPGAYHVHIWRP